MQTDSAATDLSDRGEERKIVLNEERKFFAVKTNKLGINYILKAITFY
jgi:hypothetical protein